MTATKDRRAIRRNVPASSPQTSCANTGGSWAYSRSGKWQRKFEAVATGAAIGTGIQHSLGWED